MQVDESGAHYPDGLTIDVIDALLSEMEGHDWETAPELTSALLDGSAALRRERRTARREMGALVRAFPTRTSRVTAGHASDEVA